MLFLLLFLRAEKHCFFSLKWPAKFGVWLSEQRYSSLQREQDSIYTSLNLHSHNPQNDCVFKNYSRFGSKTESSKVKFFVLKYMPTKILIFHMLLCLQCATFVLPDYEWSSIGAISSSSNFGCCSRHLLSRNCHSPLPAGCCDLQLYHPKHWRSFSFKAVHNGGNRWISVMDNSPVPMVEVKWLPVVELCRPNFNQYAFLTGLVAQHQHILFLGKPNNHLHP